MMRLVGLQGLGSVYALSAGSFLLSFLLLLFHFLLFFLLLVFHIRVFRTPTLKYGYESLATCIVFTDFLHWECEQEFI